MPVPSNPIRSPGVLGLIQMRVEPGDATSNLERAGLRARQAVALGARCLLFPEVMDFGWTHPSALREAGPIPGGHVFEGLRRLAVELGVLLCAGLAERAENRVYNAAVLLDGAGRLLLHHRKVNELDFARELYATGEAFRVADTPLGRVGLMICADAFIPGLSISRGLARLGAEVLLSPCSWAVPPDHDPERTPYGGLWVDSYGPVAREFEVLVAGCSNVGPIRLGPWAGHRCIGSSLVMGAAGRVLARGAYGDAADEILLVPLPPPRKSASAGEESGGDPESG